MRLIYVLILSHLAYFSAAQHDIAFYCDAMANSFEANHRKLAGEKFNQLFSEELAKPNSFTSKFKQLKWISVKEDSAHTFKLFSWQLKGDNGESKSFGYIQMADGSMHKLIDNTNPSVDSEYETYNPTTWLGALYYNIKETSYKGKKAYLLFGYREQGKNQKIKIIDVLTFENKLPQFGAEIFKTADGDRPDIKTRIIVDYSSFGTVNLNYNEAESLIIHDFVVSRLGIDPEGKPAKVPDGTYVAYEWDGNYWKKIDQLAHLHMDKNDIFFKPKAEDVKRDILGNAQKP
jgi:hypothetical protein